MQESPVLQPLSSLCKSFLAMQMGSQVPQSCWLGPLHPPSRAHSFGEHRGERRCPAGGMEERRVHATRPSHVQRGQKHQLSPVSWRGVMLTYRIKGKVRGVWGKNETFMTVHI